MANKPGAWGVDIGQAGLKAIRLSINETTDQVVATAFDYIPHPKILSQPDAIPEELIAQALEKFLKQNDLGNDLIAISVPGQSALARFIQLPPVEASKVSEIVKYEARQQIPFALEDVVWDYQTLGKGSEESGFLLEAEVGLFAMKREQVLNQLRPFTNAGLEIELIQIAPLALYNFLSFDQLGIRVGDEATAMDSYTILLDMGADNTMLLVSNGQKIWIRNVPIGGNHFTRALTKEMKLTFAKAEHLKCNATKSPDPRAVFQALRPVFNDYVSEIQRSIGYFSSVNRDAKISKVVGLGNGFKLAGLQKFLQQNLQYEVERVDSFGAISPDGFKDAALFEENILSFPVCYGVALQAIRQTRIRTSLLPKEITTARTIARKKPWAVAAAACLIAGLATSSFGYARVYQSVSKQRFGKSEDKVDEVKKKISQLAGDYAGAKTKCKEKQDQGTNLVRGIDLNTDWLKLYKAIDESLPRDKEDIADSRLQNRIRIFSVEPRWNPNLGGWFDKLNNFQKQQLDENDKKAPPQGGGYLVTIRGEHRHDETLGKGKVDNDPKSGQKETTGQGYGYLMENFVKKLQQWSVPSRDNSGDVGVRSIGISHVTVMSCNRTERVEDPFGKVIATRSTAQKGAWGNKPQGLRKNKRDKDNDNSNDENSDVPTRSDENTNPNMTRLAEWPFEVQFIWNPGRAPQKPGDAAGQPGQPAPTGQPHP